MISQKAIDRLIPIACHKGYIYERCRFSNENVGDVQGVDGQDYRALCLPLISSYGVYDHSMKLVCHVAPCVNVCQIFRLYHATRPFTLTMREPKTRDRCVYRSLTHMHTDISLFPPANQSMSTRSSDPRTCALKLVSSTLLVTNTLESDSSISL